MLDRELGIADLRDRFRVAEAGCIVCQRPDGSVYSLPLTKTGLHNAAREVLNGGKIVGRATGVSRKEALAAAKRAL